MGLRRFSGGSGVTKSPGWCHCSCRGSLAAGRARCEQSPGCGSPPLDAETLLLDEQSLRRPSRLPPALPTVYAYRKNKTV